MKKLPKMKDPGLDKVFSGNRAYSVKARAKPGILPPFENPPSSEYRRRLEYEKDRRVREKSAHSKKVWDRMMKKHGGDKWEADREYRKYYESAAYKKKAKDRDWGPR